MVGAPRADFEHATVGRYAVFLVVTAVMPDPRLPTVSTRLPPAFPPRWAFFKGLLTGLVIELPAHAVGIWLLAHFGVGDTDAGFMRVLRITTVFAGVAAVLTAAGIGRLAAHASIDKIGGRRHAAWVAAKAHGVASIGLLLIAAVANNHLPDRAFGWLAIVLVGLAIGALCGSVIAGVCGGPGAVRIGDVMAAAFKRPSEALRQLLDPEELLKLGAAVRQRTTELYEAISQRSKHKEHPPDEPP